MRSARSAAARAARVDRESRERWRALEADVGLSCFINSGKKLRGKLLSNVISADLQRHDVLPSGEVLHLSSLGFPAQHLRPQPSAGARPSRAKGASAEDKAWSACVYCEVPPSPRQRLSAALGVAQTALRMGPGLQLPGVAVLLARLPRGLPEELEPPEDLRSGILQENGETIALGPLDVTQRITLTLDTPCPAHRYTIVLRGLSHQQVAAGDYDQRLEEIKERGFVNFFELSSFGLAEVRRYEIGSAMWCGHWERACQLILTANRGSSDLAASSAAFAARDYAKGLETLPEEDSCEGLRALAMQLLLKREPLEALRRAVPIALWVDCLASVGRICWNRGVSARLTKLGQRPIAGDLVWDERAGEPRPLTLQDLQTGQWRLSDVVLPLPRPGEPLLKSGQRLAMEADLQELVPDQDASGSCFPMDVSKILPPVRRIVSVPSDVGWDVIESSGTAVVDCDLSRLRGGGDLGLRRQRTSPGLVLRLRCTLPRAEGAEALLREVTASNPSDFRDKLDRRDITF